MLSSLRLALSFACLIAAALGCSNDARVTGEVTFDGKSLEAGGIVFHPSVRGAAAYGSIDQGKYQLFTGQSDVVEPGEYKVTVEHRTAIIIPEGPSKGPPTEDVGERLTPDLYADPKTTPLKATVKPGANSLNFDLKSQP